jgi:hypothetical protein
MRWSWQDSAEQVLSSLLVETPEVLTIRSRVLSAGKSERMGMVAEMLQAATAHLMPPVIVTRIK